ncbi:sialidase family protein [Nonomuraea sp. NPDC050202]|jgi:predicted neuraminidase|uniref:sialidase family protein n=1 Tax=Nonomuraea sp. NPDC050202 TaxID=3155035 RepID=UPI0033C997A1
MKIRQSLLYGALAVAVGVPSYVTGAHGDGDVQVAPTGAYACRQDVAAPDPNVPKVHAAAVTQAPTGDMLTVYYGGTSEGAANQALYLSRLATGKKSWSKPEVVVDEPGKADGNPVLWSDGKRVYLFYVVIEGHGWEQASIRLKTSDDGGHTWSEPTVIRSEWGWMVGTNPIRMSNGEVLLPIYDEASSSSGFYVFSQDLSTWKAYPEDTGAWIRTPEGSIQPTVVEVEPGRLAAYMRTGDKAIYKSESTDFGRTWSAPVAEPIGNPNSRVAALKLDSGKLVLAYNPWVEHRSPMRLSLSPDKGRTWEHSVDVEAQSGPQFTYPVLTQSADGFIHLVYSYNRNNIRHVVFNEEYLRNAVGLLSNWPEHTITEFKNGVRRNVVRQCSYSPVKESE